MVLLFCFVLFFGFLAMKHVCGISDPQPGIEPAPPELEGEVLTTGLPGKPCHLCFQVIFFLNINLFIFIYLFLAALGLCCCVQVFSSCSERGLLFIAVRRLLIAVASLVAEHGLQACRLQQLWLAGCRAQAQQLWRTGLIALRHVRSSWTRARTCVPCIGRQILNHCTTREARSFFLLICYSTLKGKDLNSLSVMYVSNIFPSLSFAF